VPLADPVLTLIAETDEALAKADFRTDVVEALRSDPSFGQRVSRRHHAGLTQTRATHVEQKTPEDLDAVRLPRTIRKRKRRTYE